MYYILFEARFCLSPATPAHCLFETTPDTSACLCTRFLSSPCLQSRRRCRHRTPAPTEGTLHSRYNDSEPMAACKHTYIYGGDYIVENCKYIHTYIHNCVPQMQHRSQCQVDSRRLPIDSSPQHNYFESFSNGP